jgi:tetratricopeptide (TPR) repeat protein
VKRPDVKVRARRGYLALEPAKLLKPTPIVATPAPASPPPVTTRRSESAPAAVPDPSVATLIAPSPAPEAPETVIRTRMSGGALVRSLKGDDTAPADDPASLGWSAYQKGDVDAAKRELTKAAEAPDVHPWVHYVLGLCHLALKEFPEAAQSWERVRASTPSFEPVYFDLADAYSAQHDRAHALSVLEAAAKQWP